MGKKKDNSAKKAEQAASKAQAAQELRMRNERALADINAANEVVDVQQGGQDVPDSILDDMRRRKPGATTTSNQLGIT